MKRAVGLKNYPAKLVIAGIKVPTTPADRKFCERWMVHKDHMKAAIESGMTEKSIKSNWAKRKLIKYMPWISAQLEKREKAVAERYALKQENILDEMVAIGFANAQDYAKEIEEADATGKIIKKTIRKPLSELTRAQAAAVSSVSFHPDGTVTYDLPDERSKHPYLRDLGQHLGLFHPKLIQEHRHAHMHAAIDLRGLDESKLESFEQQLLAALGPQGERMLGIMKEVEYTDSGEQP